MRSRTHRAKPWVWAGALLASAIACEARDAGPIGELSELADRMCACTDESCAKSVLEAYKGYTTNNPVVHADEKSEAKMAAQVQRFTKCRMQKLPIPKAEAPPGTRQRYEGPQR